MNASPTFLLIVGALLLFIVFTGRAEAVTEALIYGGSKVKA